MQNTPIPPVGQRGFTLATMQETAARNGATSFTEWVQTTPSDYGYLLNPKDTPNQFGVSVYDIGNGFTVTHCVADFIPHEVRATATHDQRHTAHQTTGGSASYVSILDISVPYHLPHAIVSPRVHDGVNGLFNPPSFNPWGKEVSLVQLEGDFSEFIDAGVVKGEEPNAFLYLAPNIMELLLTRGIDFTVEFIGTHIYVYYMPRKAHVLPEGNMKMTPEEHEQVLREGLAIANYLTRAARPASTISKQPVQIQRRSVWSLLFSAFYPILILPPLAIILLIIAPFTFGISLVLAFLVFIASIVVYVRRWIIHRRRYTRYTQRYGSDK